MNPTLHDDLVARIRTLAHPLTPRPTDAAARTEPLAGIRAVLFDVYGTLVISASGDIGLGGEQDEEAAFRASLQAAGIEADAAGPGGLKAAIGAVHAERRSEGIEYPEVDILDIWSRTLALAGGLERLAVEYECRVNPVWPMPGLAEVLSALRARGLVLGIVSNAQFYTPLMLEAFLNCSLAELGFDAACCAWSYHLLEAKPSTRIYDRALAALKDNRGIEPHEVLYVGNDLRNDIWPASLTGCRTALFAGDARSLRLRKDDPRCQDVAPDRVVTDLRQISDDILPVG
jgi:putative hydrolase of the HAD superfamily